MNAVCPYCKNNLDKVPTRKKTCPNCGNNIYVRKGKLLTHKESVFVDAKTNLLGMALKGVGAAKNIDDLWEILNENILIFSKKGDLHVVSSIYLQMALICFNEGRYKDCIQNYLFCSHFSSIETIRSSKEYQIGLKFSDLMSRDNYMITSPVIDSIEEFKIEGVDTNNLGVLAITPSLTLDQKVDILREVFNGKVDRLVNLKDEDFVIVEEKAYNETYSLKVPVKKNSGCLGFFIGIIVMGIFFLTK